MERDKTASPASKAFADRLARYAYNGEPSSSRSSPLRVKREIDSSQDVQSPTASPSRVRRTAKKDSDDEYREIPMSPRKKIKTESSTKSTPTKGKKPRPYADPGMYAHLKPVTDHLKEDMDIVFCGINPGKMSSTLGHHFAHPTNKFWKSLYHSGITSTLMNPIEDGTLPERYNCGLTNLCDRPTSEQSELSSLEMKLSVPDLTAKLNRYRPRVVCFVGKKIWDIYENVVSKTAGQPQSGGPIGGIPIKVESSLNDQQKARCMDSSKEIVKIEEVDELRTLTDTPIVVKEELVISPASQTKRKTPLPKKMDWSQPRSLRLSHDDGTYTYFWVTPNTSGLERTPLSEQIQIFTHLRQFAQSLQTAPPEGLYREIDVKGIAETAETIRQTAIKQGKIS